MKKLEFKLMFRRGLFWSHCCVYYMLMVQNLSLIFLSQQGSLITANLFDTVNSESKNTNEWFISNK